MNAEPPRPDSPKPADARCGGMAAGTERRGRPEPSMPVDVAACRVRRPLLFQCDTRRERWYATNARGHARSRVPAPILLDRFEVQCYVSRRLSSHVLLPTHHYQQQMIERRPAIAVIGDHPRSWPPVSADDPRRSGNATCCRSRRRADGTPGIARRSDARTEAWRMSSPSAQPSSGFYV